MKQVAERFYRAMSQGPASELDEIVSEFFAEHATLSRPESLPGGGTLTGHRDIGRFLGKVAGKVPLELNSVVADEDGVNLFASVSISLAGQPTEALEWWTFAEDRVVSIKAFYWDTAAMTRG